MMDKNRLYRTNEQTESKLQELVDKFGGDYPSKSQAIRSAIHFLHKKKKSEIV